jgi:uncharacterized protein (UPF0332 family)
MKTTLDDKKLKEIQNRVKNLILEGKIKSKQPKEYVEFFLTNGKDSLRTARCIYDMSTNKDYQEYTGYQGLKGYLWVINASYYSMFYMARALLENEGVKLIPDLSIHSLTFDAFIHYFYLTGKLEKRLFEQYIQAQEEASELLGKQKADELVKEYFWEKGKRGKLTYETEEFAIQSIAKTSLDRAVKFNIEIRKILQIL